MKRTVILNANSGLRNFCTVVERPRSKGILKYTLIGAGLGTLCGAGYSINQIGKARERLSLEGTQVDKKVLPEKPPIPVSRRVS